MSSVRAQRHLSVGINHEKMLAGYTICEARVAQEGPELGCAGVMSTTITLVVGRHPSSTIIINYDMYE